MILLFILGTISGSFICCYAYRFIHHQSIYIGRSQCEHCRTILHYYDLIPIISYLILKGRCRYCHHKIRPINLICEISGGILFILSYIGYKNNMWIICIISLILMFIAIVDYYTYDIYLISVLLLLIAILIYKLPSYTVLISTAILITPLLLLTLCNKDSLGLGDIQLLSVISLLNTLQDNLILLLTACLIALMHIPVYKKKKIRYIPFAPYIVISAYLIMYT